MIAAGDAPNDVDNQGVLDLLQRDQNRLDSDRYEKPQLFEIPVHIDAQRRRSGSWSYLRETTDARNADGSDKYPLTIRTNSFVTEVLFDESSETQDTPIAMGVRYLQGEAMYAADRRYNVTEEGVSHEVYATREVIIAGGVFNTPQILKLSGIGPRQELESSGIPDRVDLQAVGHNMQDNYEAAFLVEASREFDIPFTNCFPFEDGDPCLLDWRSDEGGHGPYGMGAAAVGMTMRSSLSDDDDADLFFFGGAGGAFRGHYPG